MKIISRLVKIRKYFDQSEDEISESQSDIENNQQERTRLMDIILDLIKNVFAMRFVDIFAGIRLLCIEEIGLWMKTLPELFIDDMYLKYIGKIYCNII